MLYCQYVKYLKNTKILDNMPYTMDAVMVAGFGVACRRRIELFRCRRAEGER